MVDVTSGLSAALPVSLNTGCDPHQFCTWLPKGLSWNPVCYTDSLMLLETFKRILAKSSITLMTALNFLMGFDSKYIKWKRSKRRFLTFLSQPVRAHHPDFISETSFHCSFQVHFSYICENPPLFLESQPKIYWFNWFHFHVLFGNMCTFNKAKKRWLIIFHLKSII